VEFGDHAAGELLLELDLTSETLHTELSIDDAALPIDLPATGDHQVASGLLVIASLARCWGASRTDGGTRLWFDLDAASSR
jgi:UDP-N-acetylmuramyl pentapeptide synthase